MLGCTGDDHDMLVAEVAARESFLRPGQLLQVTGDLDPLGGGAPGQLALPAQPRDDRERAIGPILARLVEAPDAVREHRLEWIDSGFPNLDERLAKVLTVGLENAGRHSLDGRLQLLGSGSDLTIPESYRGA